MSPIFNPDNPKEHDLRFQPQSEADIKRASLLDPGTYDFEVVKAEDKISKNGNEMIELTLRVYVGDKSREIKDWLMEKMAFKLRHFCYAVGLGDAYEAGALEAGTFVGKAGKVILKIDEKDGFPPKNAVRDYEVTGKEVAKKAANAAPVLPVTDEPPF